MNNLKFKKLKSAKEGFEYAKKTYKDGVSKENLAALSGILSYIAATAVKPKDTWEETIDCLFDDMKKFILENLQVGTVKVSKDIMSKSAILKAFLRAMVQDKSMPLKEREEIEKLLAIGDKVEKYLEEDNLNLSEAKDALVELINALEARTERMEKEKMVRES